MSLCIIRLILVVSCYFLYYVFSKLQYCSFSVMVRNVRNNKENTGMEPEYKRSKNSSVLYSI